MSMASTGAFALGCVFLALYLRPQEKEIASLLGIAATLLLFAASVPRIARAIQDMLSAFPTGVHQETAKILVKSLGIALMAQLVADICREAGEAAVGTQVELAAKLEILLLAIPLAQELMEMAKTLLS